MSDAKTTNFIIMFIFLHIYFPSTQSKCFIQKVKTAATMVALTIVLSVPDSVGLAWTLKSMKIDVMSIGMALLFLSSFVTVTSGSVYFKAAAPVLMGKE